MSLEEDLVWYLAWRSADYGAPTTKTRLVKYLYLVDLRLSRERSARATDLDWVFYHYGPYTMELEPLIETDRSSGRLVVQPFQPSGGGPPSQMVFSNSTPPADLLPTLVRNVADEVCSRWANWDLKALLNYVYFETPPMEGAERGDHLDLLARLDQQWPRRPRPPLDPPELDEAAKEHMLDIVRRRRAQPIARLRRPVYDDGYLALVAPNADEGDDEIEGLAGHLTLGPKDAE